MEVFDALLSTEVLAGILIIGAVAISIRSMLRFSSSAANLRPRLADAERELHRLREVTELLHRRVTDLLADVSPVRQEEAQLRTYSEKLRDIAIDLEKREQAKSEEEEGSQRRRIQRKRMGLDTGSP
jgi:predicted ribosome quality control (RQC) complex YloA/Tae2 family protein